jgi:hypothetical protein
LNPPRELCQVGDQFRRVGHGGAGESENKSSWIER